jgi:flagellar basal-body rod modification protein FlgD
VQQTKALKEILGRLSGQDLAQASGFIGREARFDSPTSALGAESPARWAITTAKPARTLAISIADASGKVIHRAEIDAAKVDGRFEWDGTLADGSRAAPGAYALTVTATDAAGGKVETSVQGAGIVRDVVSVEGSVSLGLAAGVRLPLAKLVAVADAA